MHNLLEIIVPNGTKDFSKAVAQIMEPFDENGEDRSVPFWDCYSIGGRFAGQKLVHTFEPEKIEEFFRLLTENKVTASSLQCGKQEIKPASQIPLVDKLWNDFFPENDGRPCPIFNHSNNQYDKYGIICGDVMPVKECLGFKCGHVIVGCISDFDGKYEAKYMLQTEIWNGVTHQDTNWDGTIKGAIDMFTAYSENFSTEYKQKFSNILNWLSITVDYHS